MNNVSVGELTRKQRTRAKGKRLRARRVNKGIAEGKTRQAASRKNVVANRRGAPIYSGLSLCANDYLKVLEDPFSGKTACVPSEFNFPSLKHSVTAFGTFTTGTAGVGFVSVQPFETPFNGSTNATPAGSVNFSGSTFTGTAFAPASATGVFEANTDTPYFGIAANSIVQARLVGCGLRVRNTTPMLNRGGSLVGIEELNHQSLQLNAFTLQICMMEDTASPMAASSDAWKSVTYHPNNPIDIDWYTAAGSYANGPYINDFLGFIANAPPSTPQTFEWQVVAAFEAKGTSVQGLTASHSDPVGFAAVQNAVSSVEARKPHTGDRAVRYAQLAGRIAATAATAYRAFRGAYDPTPMITDA